MQPSMYIVLALLAAGALFGFTVLTAGQGKTCPYCGFNAVKARHLDWRGRPDPAVADNPERCISCGWPEVYEDRKKRR